MAANTYYPILRFSQIKEDWHKVSAWVLMLLSCPCIILTTQAERCELIQRG